MSCRYNEVFGMLDHTPYFMDKSEFDTLKELSREYPDLHRLLSSSFKSYRESVLFTKRQYDTIDNRIQKI